MNILKLNEVNNIFPTKKEIVLVRDIDPIYLSCEKSVKKMLRDKYGVYTQFDFCENELPEQGFKIHISATITNYVEVLERIFLYAKDKNITFKYISNKKWLIYTLSSNADRTNSGKFITIYPLNYEQFVTIVHDLEGLLQGFVGPYILSDMRFKGTNIFYRYGKFNQSNTNYIIGPSGEKIEDKRLPYFELPSFVKDPFENENQKYVSKKSKYIGVEYIATDVIKFRNSGGIYLGHTSDKKKIVIKEVRPYIENFFLSPVVNKKNEKNLILSGLKSKIYFPDYIDDFYDLDHYFLVESYVEGKTIQRIRSTNTITDYHVKQHFFFFIEEIFLALLEALNIIHEDKIFLGDISDTNIIINEKKNVFFVDTEHSLMLSSKNDKPNIVGRTPGFFNKTINELSLFEQDKQQLGYLLLSLFTKANFYLSLDSTGATTFNIFKNVTKLYNTPPYLIEVVYRLIYRRSTTLNELIEILNKKKQYHDKKNYHKTECSIINLIESSVDMFNSGDFSFSDPDQADFSQNIYGNDSIFGVYFNYLNTFDEILLYNFLSTKSEITRKMIEKNNSLLNGMSKELLSLYINDGDKYDIDRIQKYLLQELRYFFSNKEKKNLGLFDGILGVVYALSSKNVCIEMETTTKLFLKKFIENYIDTEVYPWNMYMFKDGKDVSPYLSNGVSGLLKTLIRWSNTYKSKYFDKEIKKIAKNLSNINYPQCCCLDIGLAGIIEALLDTEEYMATGEYYKRVECLFLQISEYIIKFNNKYFVPSKFFTSVGLDYGGGNGGSCAVYLRFCNMKEESL